MSIMVLTGSVAMADGLKTAVFAGGCFWCMQSEFDDQDGVQKVVVGFSGGKTANPTYELVSKGETGHREAILVTYDPKVVSYERLLEIFWSNVDPEDAKGQFCDKGEQYKAGIFVADAAERAAAEASKAALAAKLKAPVVTDVLAAGIFWPAEEYHQDYYKKNPLRYKLYRGSCGRDGRLDEVERRISATVVAR